MPIVVSCNCGRTLRAKDEQAGRRCRCPGCGATLHVPYPIATPIDPPPVRETIASNKPQPTSALNAALSVHRQVALPQPPPLSRTPTQTSTTPYLTDVQEKEKTWRGHVYWLLVLGIIPLFYYTFAPSPDVNAILKHILEEHPEIRHEKVHDMDEAVDKILSTVPGHKLPGAFLARESYGHWLLAAMSGALFFSFVPFAIPVDEEEVSPLYLLGVGAFTGTIGVSLLLTFQYFSICFCLIGIWYIAALNPNAPFGPSLLGFTLGVGVCEEITKVIPVLWRIHKDDITWRGACLIGMASGIGFGIAEGIDYCSRTYNGLLPVSIYLVRFLANVSQHGMMSAAASIMLFQKRKHLADFWSFYDWVLTMTAIMIVPIFLHGLFDTLLKKHFDGLALIVWAMTFAWLVWLITTMRQKEFVAAKKVVEGAAKVIRTAQGTRYVGG